MEPCKISSFTGIPIVTDVFYTVGQPDLKSGKYGFVQDPNCLYPQTLSITGMPTFATSNTATFDFTVLFMAANTDAGVYTVRIQNSISVPKDAAKTAFTPMSVDYTFKIFIAPCAVNAYT